MSQQRRRQSGHQNGMKTHGIKDKKKGEEKRLVKKKGHNKKQAGAHTCKAGNY